MDTFSIIFDIFRLLVFVLDIVLVGALIYTFPKAWAFRPKLFAERHVSPKKLYLVKSEALRNRWEATVKKFSAGTPDAMRVAEKIRSALSQPFELADHHIGISASIGVAVYPQHGSDERTLTKNADTAMYAAKNAGHNNARLYQPDQRGW